MTEKEVIDKLNFFKKTITQLKEKNTQLSKEKESLVVQLERAENAIVKANQIIKKEREQPKSENKYSESDLKELLKKASVKSKEKISELNKKLKLFEEELDKVRRINSNLELANKSLENKLEDFLVKAEIDQVLEGKITDSEFDKIIKEESKKIVVKSAEEQLGEMLHSTEGKRVVKINV